MNVYIERKCTQTRYLFENGRVANDKNLNVKIWNFDKRRSKSCIECPPFPGGGGVGGGG